MCKFSSLIATVRLLIMKTISEHLEHYSKSIPQKIAIRSLHENITKNYFELNSEVNNLANYLRNDLNLQFQDHVALISLNCYSFPLIQFACARANLILVLFDPNWKFSELSNAINLTKPKVLFCPGRKSPNQQSRCQSDLINFEETITSSIDPVNTSITKLILIDGEKFQFSPKHSNIQQTKFSKVMKTNHEQFEFEKPEPEDTVLLMFTSGSTGSPKIVPIANKALPKSEQLRIKSTPINENSQIVATVPFHHSFGSVGVLIASLIATNSTLIIPDFKYSIKSVISAIKTFNCDLMNVVPAMLVDLLNYIRSHDNQLIAISELSSLRTVVSAAAYLPPKLANELSSLLPAVKVRVLYAMTEMGCVVAGPDLQCDENLHPQPLVPLDGVSIKIVDPISKSQLKPNEIGLIMIKSDFRMSGYYGDEVMTKSMMDEHGWYDTGDLGSLNCSGQLAIKGRMKEVINRGGEKVCPVEIEDLLIANDYVISAAVIGIPNERLGEEIIGFVTIKKDANNNSISELDLEKFLETRISKWKVPKIHIVESLPLTASGKISKSDLKKMAATREAGG